MILIFILLYQFSSIQSPNTWGMEEDFERAMEFLQAESTAFEVSMPNNKEGVLQLKSIIFPELMRYSFYGDLMEQSALELAYVRGGSRVVDFSIGPFQMKPSFAEELERLTKHSPRPASRKERLALLQSVEGQLQYLVAFYQYMHKKHQRFLNRQRQEQQLYFLATAYNCGFQKKRTYIKSFYKRAMYPFGAKYPAKDQYVYAQVALSYYRGQKNTFLEWGTYFYEYISYLYIHLKKILL